MFDTLVDVSLCSGRSAAETGRSIGRLVMGEGEVRGRNEAWRYEADYWQIGHS